MNKSCELLFYTVGVSSFLNIGQLNRDKPVVQLLQSQEVHPVVLQSLQKPLQKQ